MILDIRGVSTGSPTEELRYRSQRRVIVEAADAVDLDNGAYVTLCVGALGCPVEALCAISQGLTPAAGFSLPWTGELSLCPDEELVALFTLPAAGERLSLKIKLRS